MTGRQFKYTFFFLSIFILGLKAQVIQSISISGNKTIPSSELQAGLIHFKSQKLYPSIIDSAKNSLLRIITSAGYYNSKINAELLNSDNLKNYELKMTIEEGPVTFINNISISGTNREDSLNAVSQFAFLKNSPFIQQEFETIIARLLNQYEDTGFPFAVIKVSYISFNRDSSGRSIADIYLTVDKKNLCTIDKIEIAGNTKTNSGLIIKSARMELKSLYSHKRIEKIPLQLNRLRFFEPVETPEFYLNGANEGVLRITVKEKETNSFDGIIGYVPSSQNNSDGYFTGFINIGLRNLFGSGRSALFRWQTESRETQELELKYSEPWLFNYPFNLDISLFQRKQDTTYVQRNLEGRLEYLATESISAGIIVSTQSTIPAESLVSSSIYNATSFITGLSLKYDSRDDFYAPTNGVYFSNVYKFAKKTITLNKLITSPVEGSFNLQKFEVDLALFYSFFSGQVAALSLHARELKGSNYDLSDYYQLGGTNTLRGYREKQFRGNRLLWSNFEYRFLFSNRSFGFVFLDSGYFLQSEDNARSIAELSGFKTGYGVGINIETGLGVLSVSFALANGDSFKEGKIHFGIINEF